MHSIEKSVENELTWSGNVSNNISDINKGKYYIFKISQHLKLYISAAKIKVTIL